MKPIEEYEFETGELVANFPPRFHNRNKEIVWEVANSSGYPFTGQIRAARWEGVNPPERMIHRRAFSLRPAGFDYSAAVGERQVAWYMNFADPYLFGAYDSWLMAQDELQVAEHPALASLREALSAGGSSPRTVGKDNTPTPFTISGVQRRCEIDTRPDADAGRPDGLYGNAFALAEEEQVWDATKALTPPTVSNILAIAAPGGGRGTYSLEEIRNILKAAYTGFSAAGEESRRLAGPEARAVIHTGFWGCGAFGGNRELMTILQCLAADLANADLVFWTFQPSGLQVGAGARQKYESLRETDTRVDVLLDSLFEMKFHWGVPDGN